jgi:hypothetical protein
MTNCAKTLAIITERATTKINSNIDPPKPLNELNLTQKASFFVESLIKYVGYPPCASGSKAFYSVCAKINN